MARKVLVADDDRVLVELVASRLRKAGFDVSIAFDNVQAFMMATRLVPDAVVLDVKMPGGNGLDTLRKLKASSKTWMVRVIVASSLTDPELPEQVKELGASEFLPKPFAMDDLQAALARAFEDEQG